jgi:hypothetical protein
MKIEEFIEILEAINSNQSFRLSFKLLKDGRLNRFIDDNDLAILMAFLKDVADSEPADFD